MALAGTLVHDITFREEVVILAGMALLWRHVADAAVAVLRVVPGGAQRCHHGGSLQRSL
jgi:hypothetical protein